MKKPVELPPSRETRLSDGVTEGFAEHVSLSIYSGTTTELLRGIVAIELTLELEHAKGARALALLVKEKLLLDGYVVTTDIDHLLEEVLEI